MSDVITRRMVRAYFQEAEPTMFLSGMFQSPRENFHDTQEVEFDVVRSGEQVATVISDLSTGANVNSFDTYTNKSFRPPIYDEEGKINAFDLINREYGQDPFQNPNYQANAINRAFRVFRECERKVRRAIELMASQVLQTGQLSLIDQNGNTSYALNFQPKATHFPTVTTAWSDSGADPLLDIDNLANVIRADGLMDPDMLIFGRSAWRNFINRNDVQNLLDNRRINVGMIAPEMRGQGATFQGEIIIENYRYQMWTYSGRYEAANTGTSTRFLNDDICIVMASGARMDLTFGSIPLIRRPSQEALRFLPGRIASTTRGMAMTTNAYISGNGKHLYVSAGTRPLTIPTAIDRYGAIDTAP